MHDPEHEPSADRLTAAARRKAVVAGSLGNFIEFYDWTIYGLLAAVFASQMFPGADPSVALLVSLGTFAIGFLARPLGAVLLSPLGDRYGRRYLFSLTIIGIGGGSLAIAVMPTYGAIGIAAPILILLARIVQGLAAGAEFQTGVTYLVEHSPSRRRGFFGSFQVASIVLGTLTASLVSKATSGILGQDAFEQWGWRVPFAVGALLALYGFVLRTRASETPVFEQLQRIEPAARGSITTVFRDHWLACLRVASINLSTVAYYLWTVFLPTYAHLTTGIPLGDAFVANIVSLAVFALLLPAAGALSDRIGRKPMLLAGAAGFILFTYPMLAAVRGGGLTTLILVSIAGCVFLACIDSVMAATYSELIPAHIRVTGIGIPYALVSALFGGTAPLISAAFINADRPNLVAVYVVAVMVVAGAIWLFMPETRKVGIDADPAPVPAARG